MISRQNTLKRILHDYLKSENSNSKYAQLRMYFDCYDDFYDISIEVISKLNYLYEDTGNDKYFDNNYVFTAVKNASNDYWKSRTNDEKRPLTEFWDNIDFDTIIDDSYDFEIDNLDFVYTVHEMARKASLTEQELAILLDSQVLMLDQYEIAKNYKISIRTVGNRMASIKEKFKDLNIYDYQ